MKTTFVLLAVLLAASGAAQDSAAAVPHDHSAHAGPGAAPGDAHANLRTTTGAVQNGAHAAHAGGSDAARPWTALPLVIDVPARQRQRGVETVALRNLDAGVVQVYAPGPRPHAKTVPLEGGRARVVAAPRIGSYHWVTATEERSGEVITASTVVAFSDAGPAPDALLAERKGELEIVPEVLPREHATWRETDLARFLVRFRGAPLPGAVVTLETERGSRATLVAGKDGRLTVLFPRDLPEEPARASAHGHGRPRVRFVLGAEHRDGGRRHLTAFNWVYGADPARERSMGAGLAFGLGGMLLAAPLLLRRPRRKEVRHE